MLTYEEDQGPADTKMAYLRPKGYSAVYGELGEGRRAGIRPPLTAFGRRVLAIIPRPDKKDPGGISEQALIATLNNDNAKADYQQSIAQMVAWGYLTRDQEGRYHVA